MRLHQNWLEQEKSSGTHQIEFSVGIKVQKTKGRDKGQIEDEIITEITDIIIDNNLSKIIDISRYNHSHGYWDAFFRIKAFSSKALIGLLTSHIRRSKNIRRSITIPVFPEEEVHGIKR